MMDGQMTIWEYMEQVIPVEIYGLCDDAYCPRCGRGFIDPWEVDMPACPSCGCHVDWTRWHKINDNDGLESRQDDRQTDDDPDPDNSTDFYSENGRQR